MNIKIPNQKQIIEHYGVDYNSIVWIEEIDELHHAFDCHKRRDIVEELTDVLIIMEQMKLYLNDYEEPTEIYINTYEEIKDGLFYASHNLCKLKRYSYDYRDSKYIYECLYDLRDVCHSIVKLYDITDGEIQLWINFKYERELERVKHD